MNPTILFETSWEVCNKVGGIYTVLSTKAKVLQEKLGDRLIFVGPDVWSTETPSPFFKEDENVLKGWNVGKMLLDGVSVRVGRWTIPGNPIAILVKFDAVYQRESSVFSFMWEKFGVDSLHSYGDYGEGCAFAIAAAEVIKSCADYLAKRSDRIVAHFNEWTTGMGLLYLKSHAPKIATVFTTHATSIGRSICGNGKPLYDYFHNYNGDQMASELNMQSKHSLEKAAAHNADCFTTVSKITADECEQLLEIRPVVTPNGFERAFVPDHKLFASVKKAARERLLKVAERLTGKTFAKNTFLIVTSGRNEFRNKGLDLFIDSINTLRCNGVGEVTRQTIAFILVPAWVKDAREDLQATLEKRCKSNEGLENPIITHKLHNYSTDTIYNRLEYLGFHNSVNDNVNIIYVPCYLNGNDGIFDMTYYELLPGFDAAVFGSYYEPWGYTPHEGIAFGVPTITTDLAGFGQWILENYDNDFTSSGAVVVHRTDSNYDSARMDIATYLMELMQAKPSKIKQISSAAIEASKKTDWTHFIEYYNQAFDKALKNKNK